MLEFQNGRFLCYRAFEDGLSCPLGQKRKLKALSLNKVFEVVPAYVPEGDEIRHGATWRHSARDITENWMQLE